MTALVIALTVAVGLLALLVAGLLRSHAEILRVLHSMGVAEDDLAGAGDGGVPVSLAPPRTAQAAVDVSGSTPDGGAVRAAVVATAHPTLLAFLSTGCATCTDFWQGLGERELDLPAPGTRVVVVTKGPEAESPGAVAALAPRGVRLVMSSAAFADYAVPATPYFVLVDGPSGRVVGEGTAAGWPQLSGLLRRASRDEALGGPRRRRRYADRLRDSDAELTAAGIEPGDPSLYPGRADGAS